MKVNGKKVAIKNTTVTQLGRNITCPSCGNDRWHIIKKRIPFYVVIIFFSFISILLIPLGIYLFYRGDQVRMCTECNYVVKDRWGN